MDTMLLIYGLLGVALAAAFIHFARKGGDERQISWYAFGLAIAAGIYVAFNFVTGGVPLGIELGGLILFGIVGFFGLRGPAVVLGLGWLAHAGWDIWHLVGTFASPDWYAGACIGFDVFLGLYIIFKTRRLKDICYAPVAAGNLVPGA